MHICCPAKRASGTARIRLPLFVASRNHSASERHRKALASTPNFDRMISASGSPGRTSTGVNTSDTESAGRAFIRHYHWRFTNITDRDGSLARERLSHPRSADHHHRRLAPSRRSTARRTPNRRDAARRCELRRAAGATDCTGRSGGCLPGRPVRLSGRRQPLSGAWRRCCRRRSRGSARWCHRGRRRGSGRWLSRCCRSRCRA